MTVHLNHSDVFNPYAGLLVVGAALARQSRGYLRVYSDAFDIYDTFAQSWLERRRADLVSGIATAERISDAANGQEAIHAYHDWIFDSLRRFGDDAVKLGEKITSVQSRAFSDLQQDAETAEPGRTVRAAGQDGGSAEHEGGEQRLAS